MPEFGNLCRKLKFSCKKVFFSETYAMEYIRCFVLGYLCFGSFVFLPFEVRAEVTKIDFDAKDYQSDRDWKKFIEALCETLKQHPDHDKNDNTFRVYIQNGAVLGTNPQPLSDYFKNDEECRHIKEVLSKISILRADTEQFSILSLKSIFIKVTEIHLYSTKTVTGSTITGSLEECSRNFNLIFYRRFVFGNNPTWSQFLEKIRRELMHYPDDDRIHFALNVQNVDNIFARDPGDINYGACLAPGKEPTEITKILSRINFLETDAKHFSTLSLTKVFPWVQVLLLPNAERISGALKEITFGIRSSEELRTMKDMKGEICPHLQVVSAPKVTEISNAAFFNFKYLEKFNSEDTLTSTDSECPAIVCTPLADGYFKQDKIPANVRITPISFKKKINKYQRGPRKGEIKETYYQCDGKTVKIGACAFQRCSSLQHVSAHASFIGSAAFAASGLKSAHLLLSKDAPVGDDVFFNCFNLKECLMMLGEMESGTVNSFFNGLFWNCFALETVCMPNIGFYPSSYRNGEISKRKEPGLEVCKFDLTLFDNCFSLRELDLRYFADDYKNLLPCGVKQSNHILLAKGDYRDYFASFFASYSSPRSDDIPLSKRDYVARCCEKTEKPLKFLGYKDSGKYTKMNPWDGNPCCDVCLVTFNPRWLLKKGWHRKTIPMMSCHQPIHLNNSDFCTLIEADSFSSSAKTLYDECMLEDQRPVFRRFNDAYRKWFGKEKKESKSEEKPKNDLLNKKRKCPFFVVHGG